MVDLVDFGEEGCGDVVAKELKVGVGVPVGYVGFAAGVEVVDAEDVVAEEHKTVD